MTRRESAIISLYTGFLCGPFEAMHEYAEELEGRPVFTHEFGNQEFVDRLKYKCKPDFINLAESVEDE